jgi:hypothetical protein
VEDGTTSGEVRPPLGGRAPGDRSGVGRPLRPAGPLPAIWILTKKGCEFLVLPYAFKGYFPFLFAHFIFQRFDSSEFTESAFGFRRNASYVDCREKAFSHIFVNYFFEIFIRRFRDYIDCASRCSDDAALYSTMPKQ